MNNIPKITLDNNCVINLLDRSASTPTSIEPLQELIRLGLSNKIEIAITTRGESDLENDKDDQRKGEMMRNINIFPILGVLPPDGDKTLFNELQRIIFPGGLNSDSNSYQNKHNDLEHLVGHLINKRDIFVTDDTGILKKKVFLQTSPGVLVMKPQECVDYLHELDSIKEKRILQADSKNGKYQAKALQGKVSFDYSNNNGRYIIGEGYFLFETMWSAANYLCIHAYSDPESINAIALAKGITNISEITDATIFDDSSRARDVNEGQILILRNVNGIYAAIKVLDIKEERKDQMDEITFEYVIQTNGTANFAE